VKRFFLAAAILAIAAAIVIARTIPPARLALATSFSDGTVAGIVHVHTDRSDGRSSAAEIATAAARAGLTFVIFTDHGDATRTPDPPVYASGVLCLDAVEISTAGGHYIALDMPPAPYPLAGEPRDVVDDVRRFGGFGIVAHPDSPKPELRWRDWDAPFDAVETMNLDSAWRAWVERAAGRGATDAPTPWAARRRLAAALLDYPLRPAETMAGLTQPHAASTRSAYGSTSGTAYETTVRRRRVVSIAGADAHANLEYGGDPSPGGMSIPLPSYLATFRTMSVRVALGRALSGDAAADARVLLRAIRDGHLYTAVDGFASPPSIEFTATNDRGTVHEGDELGAAGPVLLHVRSNAPPSFTTVVWNSAGILSGDRHEADFTVPAPADPDVYWMTIAADRGPGLTWVRTNPIYVRGPSPPAAFPPTPTVIDDRPIFDGQSDRGWTLEHDPNSRAALDVPRFGAASELRLRYGLAGGAVDSQFVALVHDVPTGVAPSDRVAFTARAEHPMRISVQLRVAGGERWGRSVYVDAFDQELGVPFGDLVPIGTAPADGPAAADVRSVLFVIDTVHAKPGASGRLWIRTAALQRTH
jgi:hypothetical protein